MGKLTATYHDDKGNEIAQESVEAWEASADAFAAALHEFENVPVGLVPEVVREARLKALRALTYLNSITREVATQARYYERAGREKDDALKVALEDARGQGKID
jgi:hypothetical protein